MYVIKDSNPKVYKFNIYQIQKKTNDIRKVSDCLEFSF